MDNRQVLLGKEGKNKMVRVNMSLSEETKKALDIYKIENGDKVYDDSIRRLLGLECNHEWEIVQVHSDGDGADIQEEVCIKCGADGSERSY